MDIVHSPIEQRNTGKGNPAAMLHFDRPLNNRQQRLLDALPKYDSRVVVNKKNANLRDLAALTAHTGVEYAMFTRKAERLIIRGNSTQTNISIDDAKEMASAGWRWSGHTHPGIDVFCLVESDGDLAVLAAFGQNGSCILNSAGHWTVFRKDV